MSDEAQISFDIGEKLYKQKNYGEAVSAFARAVRLNPENAQYRTQFSWALLNDKDYEKAIEQASKAIEIDSNMSTAYRCRAWAFADIKNFDQALKDITKAIELDSNNPKNYATRGYIYLIKQDFQNSLLDDARYNDLSEEVSLQSVDDDSDGKFALEIINSHLKNIMYPQIKTNGEIMVGYWPSFLIWGRETQQVMLDKIPHKQEQGSIGIGYVCLTNQNLRLVCLGKLGETFEKDRKNSNRGFLSFVLGPLRNFTDNTKVETTDQYWTILNSNIKDAQIMTDEFLMGKEKMLFIATPLVTYQIHVGGLQQLAVAINMAMTGKFSEIWSHQARLPSEAIALAKQAKLAIKNGMTENAIPTLRSAIEIAHKSGVSFPEAEELLSSLYENLKELKMPKVFISYSKSDVSFATDIYWFLRKNGCNPWMDIYDLVPGQDWDLEIRHNIKSSDFFIACLSNNSVSKRGYVQKELKEALSILEQTPEGEIYIIPIRVDDCLVPDSLASRHWLDWHTPNSNETLLRAIKYKQ